jgi:hypothetical protein
MAKGTGIYGNFNGKIGNTVGFKIAHSRNRQNQGVRIYQPSVGNPKTAAQAEQRARVAAVQATYTMLRNIIDRGNERQPYGYASRVAWLRQAYRSEIFPWYPKGDRITAPVICPLTFGTIQSVDFQIESDTLVFPLSDSTIETSINDTGDLTDVLLTYASGFREGDQLTLVFATPYDNGWRFEIKSYILDTNTSLPIENWSCSNGQLSYYCDDAVLCAAAIISRQGANGEHLRSTSYLKANSYEIINAPYNAASKAAAIASYQNAGAANSDWSEDPDI